MSDIYLQVEGEQISARPTYGRNNKVLVTPQQIWFWPFEWENLDDYVEHYKVQNALYKVGHTEDEFIDGYQTSEGTVKLYDWRETPPDWLAPILRNTFLNREKVLVNDVPYSY
jgi:hypothetical protein